MAIAERYSKVTRRMWRDERFIKLSPPKPNAQTLWIFLLTCPTRGGVPGLLALGELSLADEIGWPLAATKHYLAEIESAEMLEVDRHARLIWIPNALRHNAPESPNVVRSWAAAWRELPECELKSKAQGAILAHLLRMGEPFGKAFRQAIGQEEWEPYRKPSRKAPAKTSANQEQEQIYPPNPPQAGGTVPSGSAPPERTPRRPWEAP